jgi:hypothetical protein
MSAVATYNLPDFVVGNTWQGVPSYQITPIPNGAGNLDEVEIEFRSGSPTNPVYIAKLTASGGDITLVPGTWSFIIPSQVLPLPAGTFYQSIKLIDDSATPQPYTYTVGTITGILPSTR